MEKKTRAGNSVTENFRMEDLKVEDLKMDEFQMSASEIKKPKVVSLKQNYRSNGRQKQMKKRYTFMILTNGSKEKVRKTQISSRGLDGIIVIFLILLAIATYGITHISGTLPVSVLSGKEVEELKKQNIELTQQNTELTNKVAILSDTINQKLEEENKEQQENAEKCMPTGFPLSGTASMTEANANEAAGPGGTYVPMIIFESSVGTNVISTGDGVVSYVGADDTDYGNMIKIDHGNGYVSVYRNAASTRVSEGDEIPRGTVLFLMDETSTKLGYEILNEDKAIDPLELLEIAG